MVSASGHGPGGRSAILVVDDDEGIRENLAELLALDGYRIFTAASAEEALTRLESEDVDLILTDFQMPGASGVELIEAARRSHPALPAIVITAHPFVYEQIDETQKRGVRLLLKPFGADEVLNLVASILRD